MEFHSKLLQPLPDSKVRGWNGPDYEGSMIYDEYPDRYSLQALAKSMLKVLEKEEEDPPAQAMIQVLLCDEIYKRRHGGRRGKIF